MGPKGCHDIVTLLMPLFLKKMPPLRLFLTNTGLDVQMTKDGYDIQSLEKKKSSRNTPRREMYQTCHEINQWLFLVPLKGGR